MNKKYDLISREPKSWVQFVGYAATIFSVYNIYISILLLIHVCIFQHSTVSFVCGIICIVCSTISLFAGIYLAFSKTAKTLTITGTAVQIYFEKKFALIIITEDLSRLTRYTIDRDVENDGFEIKHLQSGKLGLFFGKKLYYIKVNNFEELTKCIYDKTGIEPTVIC